MRTPSAELAPPCPCGNPAGYLHCCGQLHAGGAAATPEALMRARFCAYALQREDYLLATWHPATRPGTLSLAAQRPAPTWLGLQIRGRRMIGAEHATVEFVARYRIGGGCAQRLHETSRFTRVSGCWYYVDGEIVS